MDELTEAIQSSLADIISASPPPVALPLQTLRPPVTRASWHRPALVAAAAIALVGAGFALTDRPVTLKVAGSSEPAETSLAPTTVADTAVLETTVAETPKLVPKAQLSRTLEKGLAAADDVRAVQQRLNDLHFDVGAADGIYGPNTEMAVWAYQSLILNLRGSDVTGKVTPDLWSRMQDPLGLPEFRPDSSATHVEVNLPAQTMALWVNHELRVVTHVSSGSGQKWCDEFKNVPAWPGATTTTLPAGQKNPRYCGLSLTPGGVFKVNLKRKDWIDIPLGRVFNPISFNAGIAIHGYPDVPKNPASHGCVRVPMHIATYLPDILHVGDQVFVWDGVKEPEVYGDQKPPFDERDPTDTTVVTTTSTTIAKTTTTLSKPATTPTSLPVVTTVALATTTVTVATTTTTTSPAPTPSPTTSTTTSTTSG